MNIFLSGQFGCQTSVYRVTLHKPRQANVIWLLEKQDRYFLSMARPLRLYSLFSRLGALSVASPVFYSYRFASRVASRAGMGQSHVYKGRASNRVPRHSDEMSEEEPALEHLEDVEDKFQALVDEEKKSQRMLKYQILRRQMSPPGPPQRKLTWDAIEHIRYLKQEQPEEWTVQRLAEGFSVTPDVILRVLRSRFVPTPGRKAKQDFKVMTALRQQVLPSGAGTGQDRPKLPGNHKPAILLSANREGALVPVADQTLLIQQELSGPQAKIPVTVLPSRFKSGIIDDAATKPPKKDDITANTNLPEKDEEDSWDGQVLTEEELKELMEMEKPSPVVKIGKEFFDAEGNFLYRI